MSTSSARYELTPVTFSRLSRRGVILGLSASQLVCLAIAGLLFVASLYTAGTTGLLYTAPGWAAFAAAALVTIQSRKVIEWAPVTLSWQLRQATGQTHYRRRIVKPRAAGTLALPGDAARLRQYVHPETGAVMVHDPHQATLTAMVDVDHRGLALLDPADQERRTHGWGRVLSTVCRSPHLARLQVLERARPDSGTGLAQWWAEHGTADSSWAATTYQELIDQAGPASEQHRSTIALSLDMRAAARIIRSSGGGLKGAAAVLTQDMATLTSALRAAELHPGPWYTPGRLAVALRSAYDTAMAATLDRSGKLGEDLATAGPVAVDEEWAMLHTDSAYHAVYWISEWPRSKVYPGFLSPLLLTNGIQATFTVLMDPIRADVAARQIRKRKTEHLSDRAQRARLGQIEDAAITAEYADVLQQEAELTAGHGVLRYTGLVTVAARSGEELEASCARIEQAAIQVSCELRRVVGQQAQAFTAAALPLCRHV
ncbi:SCO6880 family protein [Gryllotalpicola reticulitermitis]|uniref:SCO6880 family protein n=1 Tax=Gryllotalpicola reticulitermitis TaxID=1184153 RepID=A0ABV8QAY7_9MICO